MSTSVVERTPSLEELQAVQAQLQSMIDLLANEVVEDGAAVVTTEKPISKKAAKKALVALQAQQAKDLKKAKKKAKKAKVKAKKSKKGGKRKKAKKGWAAATAAATVGGLVKARKSIVRGARTVARGSRRVGRKMWLATLGAGTWAWSKMGLAGRKIAGATSWVIQGGSRLVRFMLGGVGWGWALVGIAGVVVLGLVAWGVGSGAEAMSAPAAWVAAGRPGTLKKFKAKRKGKALKKQSKKLRRAKKLASKRVSEIDKELTRTLKARAKLDGTKVAKVSKVEAAPEVSKTEVKQTEVVESPDSLPSAEVVTEISQSVTPLTQAELDRRAADDREHEAKEHRLVLAVAHENYEGLDMAEVCQGLSVRNELMYDAGVPKEVYSVGVGRYYTANAIWGNEVLRGKPLYEKLQKECIGTFGDGRTSLNAKRKLASQDINWTQFQAGVVKEQELLKKFGLDQAEADAEA